MGEDPIAPREMVEMVAKHTRRTRSLLSRKTTASININSEYGVCPQCGKSLVKRQGPRGEFLGCSGFPKRRFTRPLS